MNPWFGSILWRTDVQGSQHQVLAVHTAVERTAIATSYCTGDITGLEKTFTYIPQENTTRYQVCGSLLNFAKREVRTDLSTKQRLTCRKATLAFSTKLQGRPQFDGIFWHDPVRHGFSSRPRGNRAVATSPTSSRRRAAPLKTVNTLTAMSACLRSSSTGSGLTGVRLQPGRMPNARLWSATVRTTQCNQHNRVSGSAPRFAFDSMLCIS